ncbi:MAG: hypothetical protein ACOC7X_11320 [Spirochaetota bacterium]
MKKIKFGLLFLCTTLVFLSSIAAQAVEYPPDDELKSIVSSIDANNNSTTELGKDDFNRFLDYAVRHKRNLFEVLNLTYPILVENKTRYKISGKTILSSEEEYNLGGSKIRVILPIDSVIHLEIGASFTSSQSALDVFIEEPYTEDFYGFGKLHEDTHFGFKEIRENYFKEAFGMQAKRMVFTFDVSHLHLYETEEIAIHLKNFFKPKREVFKAVEFRKQK